MEWIIFIDGLTADSKCVAHDTGVSDNVSPRSQERARARCVPWPSHAGLSKRMTVTQVRREGDNPSQGPLLRLINRA